MDLKNITVSDLKEKLLTFTDKKTLIKFGIGFGAILVFLIIYYAILNPMVKSRKATYQDKVLKEEEISNFEYEIVTIKKRKKNVTPIYEKTSTLIHSKAEVEYLNQSLSSYAALMVWLFQKLKKKIRYQFLNLV